MLEALERTSKNGRATGEQEPQIVCEALERTSKTAGILDVAGLCRELPDRVAELAKLKGARLSK